LLLSFLLIYEFIHNQPPSLEVSCTPVEIEGNFPEIQFSHKITKFPQLLLIIRARYTTRRAVLIFIKLDKKLLLQGILLGGRVYGPQDGSTGAPAMHIHSWGGGGGTAGRRYRQ
jgi:hypothetical protein